MNFRTVQLLFCVCLIVFTTDARADCDRPTLAHQRVAEVDKHGRFHFTETNAYSGNNGRAAILNNRHGASVFYLAGNAGNGGNPQPDGVIIGAGAQFVIPSREEEAEQTPSALPTPLACFNITQVDLPHDKIGKDTNFRGLTVFHNVV